MSSHISYPVTTVRAGLSCLMSIDKIRFTSLHNFSEHLELSLGVEGYEVHASVPAKVTPVEPIPVLEIKKLFRDAYIL